MVESKELVYWLEKYQCTLDYCDEHLEIYRNGNLLTILPYYEDIIIRTIRSLVDD